MKLNQLKTKKILILGFGREGMSSYRYIRRHFKSAKIGVADSKKIGQFESEYGKILKSDKNLELFLGKNYLKSLDKFEVIIKTPGIKLNEKTIKGLKKKNIKLSSSLNIFLTNIKGKIVGVTGSKGKGTVATLIYKILKAGNKKVYLVGNIGQPFLDYINQDSKNTIYVAELSSFHLDTLKGKIDVGMVISFFPEHLEYHSSVNEYFKAKMNLVKNLKSNGVVVYNRNYKKVADFIKKQKVKSIGYNKPKIKVETKLLGEHNLENIAGVIEVAKLFKVKNDIILKTIKNFKGLPYRLEPVGKFRGINFYCDTLGTTPETAIKALSALKEKNLQTLIVGGVSKGGDYKILAKEIIKSKIRTLIMLPNVGIEVGKLVKKIHPVKSSAKSRGAKQFDGVNSKNKPNLVVAKNMKQAVDKSFKLTQAGESVCLSPAGASFDFYKNYSKKGEDYKKEIINYK